MTWTPTPTTPTFTGSIVFQKGGGGAGGSGGEPADRAATSKIFVTVQVATAGGSK